MCIVAGNQLRWRASPRYILPLLQPTAVTMILRVVFSHLRYIPTSSPSSLGFSMLVVFNAEKG